jgi:ring-1,2-phenylacetyl-CoA epoxidase subunit PaaE
VRGFHELPVAAVDQLCEDAVAVTFGVPGELADRFAFRAGQSVTVRRCVDGADERRTYSVCSPVGGPLRIGVREVPGGVVSSWLVRSVRPGDVVEVSPPIGAFTPSTGSGGHHVLIAAGSGITPVLSIAATVLPDPSAAATVLYGNRRADTVMFAGELADLKDSYPDRLQLVHVLSREPQEAALLSGRIDAARLRILLGRLVDVPAVAHWWLCGPVGMISDALTVLGESGVDPGRVHRELFYAGDPPVRPVVSGGPSAEVTVVLDGRSTPVTVEFGGTILDGAQRVRPDLPFACKGGVCGTCRARITDGKVRMRRNFALEPAEIEAGFVLTCQSEPLTGAVTADFDTR